MARRSLPLALGAMVLGLSLLGAAGATWWVLQDPVTGRLDRVEVRRAGLGLAVEAHVVLEPKVRATFGGLDGTLLVADQRLDWQLTGLAPGDPLAPGSPREFSVEVELGPTALAAAALRTAGAGELTLAFDGEARASVLGIEGAAPLRFEHRVEF